MKKNRKGFTLIELLVVVAIIGILAGLLIPGLMNKTVDAKIKTANSNAKIVHNAASTAMQQLIVEESTILTSGIPANAVGTDGGSYPSPATLSQAVQNELGSNFKGAWHVEFDTTTGNVKYALWSKSSLPSDISQRTSAKQTTEKGKVGCHPLSDGSTTTTT